MRPRLLLLAAVAVTSAAASVAAHGCSDEQPFESACLWMADPDNCYREFYEGMQSYAGVNPTENPSGYCKPGGSPTEANQGGKPAGTPNGSFSARDKLDTCILDQGGSIALDPPLDLTMWPPDPLADPVTYTVKFVAPDGNPCGQATYTSPHGFTFTVNAPPDAGSTVGAGGSATTTTGSTTSSTASYPYGTFSSVIAPGRDAFDVTCPSGESHHFNLNEINGVPGASQGSCPGLSTFFPSASFQVYPGGIDVSGAISFAITFPPTTGSYPDASPNAAPVANPPVVFFNCTIPAGAEQCANGVKDGQESDIDCGGPQIPSMNMCGSCPARCAAMQQCICDDDCDQTTPQICAVVAQGMKQCTAATGGLKGNANCTWKNAPVPTCPDAGTGTDGTDAGGTDAGSTDDGGPADAATD